MSVDTDEDYVDSLDRLIIILRGQLELAQAIGMAKIAISIENLKRILDILEGDKQLKP